MASGEKSQTKPERPWKPFTLNISLVILIFILGIFIGVFIRNKQLIENEIFSQAKSHFQNVVLTRRWNANYGGVFVEKTEGIESNPYLENPDITATDGKVYTKKNPALMTREISEYAKKDGTFQYHITSLLPLNPGNVPDEFEKTALNAFETGGKEFFVKETVNGEVYFRYMAPLITEKSCLKCHAKQGYKTGDIRGGISVKLNITEVENAIRTNTIVIFSLGAVTVLFIIGIIYIFILKLMKTLKNTEDEKTKLITELQKSLHEIKTLKGLIPICASCKKMRNDEGFWQQLEEYVGERTEAEFTHGICPECRDRLYPELKEKT